jgi:hypothetical protein
MTEDQARALLRKWPGVGQFEGWIADQPWRIVRDGWVVSTEFQGCRFHLEPIESGLRITASAPQARSAVWIVSTPADTP